MADSNTLQRSACSNRVREKFVNIGSLKEQWLQVRSIKGCKSDEDVARLLIKSLYQLERKKGVLHPGKPTGGRKRRNMFSRGRCRVLVLQNDVWLRWQELKHSLGIDGSSELATVLTDAWYERVNQTRKLFDTEQSVSEWAVQSNSGKSVSDSRADKETDNMVNGETETSQSVEDPVADREMNEILTYARDNKKLIKLTEEETERGKDLAKRRKSSRVLSRGFRPNYASLDWKDDSESDREIKEKFDDMSDYKQEINEEVEENTYKRTKVKSSKHFNEREENEIIEKMRSFREEESDVQKKKTKKYTEEDPDFVVSDNDIKHLDVSDEDTKDLDFSDICDNETVEVKDGNLWEMENETSKQKSVRRKRRNKSDNSLGVKCKRKRIKRTEDELEYRSGKFEKKSKAERKVKKETGGEAECVKKPWMHIKLEDHLEKYRIETVGSYERKNRNSNLTEELYTCLQCGRFKSTAKDIFEEHIEKHVNLVLECDRCTYVGRSEVEVMRHKWSAGHMRNGQEYMCDICGMVLYTWDSRLSHMGKEHDDPQFKCKFCNEKFVTRLKRQQHTRTVHADVAQYCNSCKTDCQTLTVEEFRQHQENCKPCHQCQVCGVVLASKNGLSNHLKATHMGVRKYQCQLCPYAGKSSQRLREHVMTHTSVHPYSCDKCTFTCVQACQLKSHMRTHSGEKPFKCTLCKFAAAWNVQLKYHLSIHELETSVTCEQCDVLFKNEKTLKMHEKKDHSAFKVFKAEETSI